MGQWGEISLRVITPLIAGIGAHLVSVIVDAPPCFDGVGQDPSQRTAVQGWKS